MMTTKEHNKMMRYRKLYRQEKDLRISLTIEIAKLQGELNGLRNDLNETRKAHHRATEAWLNADARLEALGQETFAGQLLRRIT